MLLFVRVDGNNVRIWASFARSYRFAFAMSMDLRDGNWSISTFVFFLFSRMKFIILFFVHLLRTFSTESSVSMVLQKVFQKKYLF